MKKVFCVALVVCCLLAGALADGVDLSGMSYTELVELSTALNQEIMSRPEWQEVKVPAGRYTVGIDLPAGRYMGTLKEEPIGLMFVTVYPCDPEKALDCAIYTLSDTSSSVFLSLNAGMVLQIDYNGLWLSPYKGLFGM